MKKILDETLSKMSVFVNAEGEFEWKKLPYAEGTEGQPYDIYWVGGSSCPKQSAYNPIFEYISETSIPKFCGEEICLGL